MAERRGPGGRRPGPARVVLVVSLFPKFSETFIVAKFRGLLGRGWDVHVACTGSPEEEWARFPDIDDAGHRARAHVTPRHRPRWAPLVLAPAVLLRCYRSAPDATRRYLRNGWRRFGPDVLRRLYLDSPVVACDPDVVHFEFGALAPERMHLGELLERPVTVSFRGYDVDQVAVDDPAHYDRVWAAVDRVHVLGEYLWRRVRERGCPEDVPHQVITPAIDVTSFVPAPRRDGVLGTADRPVRLLTIARTEWQKGHEHALAADAALRGRGVHVEHRVCGDGPHLPAVWFARHQFGLTTEVDLLGAVPQSEVREHLAWADVLVHPALIEGFGNAVLEAQATGLPVVSTDAGGLRESVEDGVTGLIVPRGDADALAGAIERLASDPGERARLAAAGPPRVAAHFALPVQLDHIEAFYRAVMAADVGW